MKLEDTSRRGQAFDRPSNVLIAIADEARSIRKLLRSAGKRGDQEAWRHLHDAVRLAQSIEALASHAAGLTAEDAIASLDMLEMMLEQLEDLAARILAC